MKTLQEKYNAIQEGAYSKAQFVRDCSMELPNVISRTNSYDDVVTILKNKGMVTESKKEDKVAEYEKPHPGVPLEAFERAVDYELEATGIDTAVDKPTQEEYQKAAKKANKNLDKDPNHYLHLMSGDSKKVDKHDQFKEYKDKDKVDTVNGMKKADLKESYEDEDYERMSREVEYNISAERDIDRDQVDLEEEETPVDQRISADKLLKIAKLASEIVPDASDELKELIVFYGEQIPKHRIKRILNNYDLSQIKLREAMSRTKSRNEMKHPGYPSSKQTNQYAQRAGKKLSKAEKEEHEEEMSNFVARLKKIEARKKKNKENLKEVEQEYDNRNLYIPRLKQGDKLLVDMGDGSQEEVTVARTFIMSPPKGKRQPVFTSKEYGEDMWFTNDMVIKPVKEGIHDFDITSASHTNAGLRSDMSQQEEHIRDYMYIRKIDPILEKHGVSFEDFIKMAEVDNLTPQELDDLDYVEDRIMAHLSHKDTHDGLGNKLNEGRRKKIKGGKAIKENDYDSGGYVEMMQPRLDDAIDKVLKVWDQWKNGPATEPGMIPHAEKDLVDYFTNKLRQKLTEDEKADKDYDGDGEIESPEQEYLGSRDTAIKQNIEKEGINQLKEMFKKKIINILKENNQPLNEAKTENLEEFLHYENEDNEDLAARIRKAAAELEDIIGSLEKNHIDIREKVESIYKQVGSFMAPAVAAAFKKDLAPVLNKLHNIQVPKGKRMSREEMEELGIDPTNTTGTVFSLKENKKGRKTKYTKRK